MTEYKLTRTSALNGYDRKIDGAHLKEEIGYAIIAVTMANGARRGFNAAIKSLYDCDAPDARNMAVSGSTRIIASALDQVFIVAKTDPEALEAQLIKAFGKHATITNQSDGWVMLSYSGTRVHEGLERLSMNDTRLTAFPEGSVMRLSLEHVNAILCRDKAKRGEKDRFLILSQRSTALSFLHGITDTVPFIED